MFCYGFLSFAAVLLCLGSSYATSEEQSKLKEAFHPFVHKCAEKYGITEEQFEEAKEKRSVDDIDPCFVSCVLKESGLFDSAGKFDIEKTKEFMKSHLESEPAILFMETVCSECAKVNDEDVTDGDEGCDRAKMMWGCILEVKEKLEGSD